MTQSEFHWQPFVILSLSTFTALVSLESFVARRRKVKLYKRDNSIASVIVLFGYLTTTTLWNAYVVHPTFVWFHQFSLWQIGPKLGDSLSAFLTPAFLALVLLDDLTYYIHHRISHRVPFLFAIHETHHTSKVYNILVAARVPWIDFTSFVFWIPLVLLGFHPAVVMMQHALNMTYNLFLHTELVRKMGFLESFWNTPSHHRVHHGTQAKYIDKNFGCLLIIWDKMFGTFQPEEEQSEYGTVPDLKSESVYDIVTHGVRSYFKLHVRPLFKGAAPSTESAPSEESASTLKPLKGPRVARPLPNHYVSPSVIAARDIELSPRAVATSPDHPVAAGAELPPTRFEPRGPVASLK